MTEKTMIKVFLSNEEFKFLVEYQLSLMKEELQQMSDYNPLNEERNLTDYEGFREVEKRYLYLLDIYHGRRQS